jgi:hypothetical protein
VKVLLLDHAVLNTAVKIIQLVLVSLVIEEELSSGHQAFISDHFWQLDHFFD